jgi:hypothetical protein
MTKKSLVLLLLFLLFVASSASAAEELQNPREVMEVSNAFESSSSKLLGMRCILLHHAHAENRQTLSQ